MRYLVYNTIGDKCKLKSLSILYKSLLCFILEIVKSHRVKQPCMLSPAIQTQVALSTLSRSGRISKGGDITPAEELWCTAVEDLA